MLITTRELGRKTSSHGESREDGTAGVLVETRALFETAQRESAELPSIRLCSSIDARFTARSVSSRASAGVWSKLPQFGSQARAGVSFAMIVSISRFSARWKRERLVGNRFCGIASDGVSEPPKVVRFERECWAPLAGQPSPRPSPRGERVGGPRQAQPKMPKLLAGILGKLAPRGGTSRGKEVKTQNAKCKTGDRFPTFCILHFAFCVLHCLEPPARRRWQREE